MTHAFAAFRLSACPVAAIAATLLWAVSALGAHAQPAFPELTGRVVDQADLISPAAEAELSQQLEALERDTTDQLVVVTIPDLDGYDIADYGYQLGRHWAIGQAEGNNGVLLIVARDDRKVRIEVGYGLEPVLTDAMSSIIIQREIIPPFRSGDFEKGITNGVAAIDNQLRLDPAEAQARAAAAKPEEAEIDPAAIIAVVVILFVVFGFILRVATLGGRRRRGRDGLSPILIWAASEALRNSSRGGGGGGRWGGGGGFGGGGFGGGGGSFGGGGASGGW